jgi:hypothetical protein
MGACLSITLLFDFTMYVEDVEDIRFGGILFMTPALSLSKLSSLYERLTVLQSASEGDHFKPRSTWSGRGSYLNPSFFSWNSYGGQGYL